MSNVAIQSRTDGWHPKGIKVIPPSYAHLWNAICPTHV